MLMRTELMRLDVSLRQAPTLIVYLGSPASDPAERAKWRRELESALKCVRQELRGR